jgi:hypothetical protein
MPYVHGSHPTYSSLSAHTLGTSFQYASWSGAYSWSGGTMVCPDGFGGTTVCNMLADPPDFSDGVTFDFTSIATYDFAVIECAGDGGSQQTVGASGCRAFGGCDLSVGGVYPTEDVEINGTILDGRDTDGNPTVRPAGLGASSAVDFFTGFLVNPSPPTYAGADLSDPAMEVLWTTAQIEALVAKLVLHGGSLQNIGDHSASLELRVKPYELLIPPSSARVMCVL